MFLSRLEQAIEDSKRSTKALSSSSPVKSATQTHTQAHTPTHTQPQRKSAPRLLHELNEYLFDLFDANMTADYQVMHAFEEKALAVFEREEKAHSNKRDDDKQQSVGSAFDYKQQQEVKEFSHELFELHREFLALFEGLIEKFLRSHAYAAEEVYEELFRFYALNKEEKSRREKEAQLVSHRYDDCGDDYDEGDFERHPERYARTEALEVLDVLAFYTDFALWSSMMRQTAQHRIRFREEKGETTTNNNNTLSLSSSYFGEQDMLLADRK